MRRRWRLGDPGGAVRAARTSAVWSMLSAAATVTLLSSWSRLVPLLDRPTVPAVVVLVVLSAVVAVGSAATLTRLRGRGRE